MEWTEGAHNQSKKSVSTQATGIAVLIKMLFEFDHFFHASNHHIKMKSYRGLYRMYFFCLQIHVGLYSGGGAYDRKFMLFK